MALVSAGGPTNRLQMVMVRMGRVLAIVIMTRVWMIVRMVLLLLMMMKMLMLLRVMGELGCEC